MSPSEKELRRRMLSAKTDDEENKWAKELAKMQTENDKKFARQDAFVRKQKRKHGQKKPKPAGTLDARSHKHAIKDASTGGSGIGGAFAPVASAYAWAKGNGYIDEEAAIHKIVSIVPDYLWLVIGLLGVGWWLLVYVATLAEKREREY